MKKIFCPQADNIVKIYLLMLLKKIKCEKMKISFFLKILIKNHFTVKHFKGVY